MEVKGGGSRDQTPRNYFLEVLGELFPPFPLVRTRGAPEATYRDKGIARGRDGPRALVVTA